MVQITSQEKMTNSVAEKVTNNDADYTPAYQRAQKKPSHLPMKKQHFHIYYPYSISKSIK
jgi:hypothetical protein